MSADRDMLELAAKAVGITLSKQDEYRPNELADVTDPSKPRYWNPLADDGDALRLAVACRMTVCTDGDATVSACEAWRPETGAFVTQRVSECQDKSAATRRAIVRAAAEIGRAMP